MLDYSKRIVNELYDVMESLQTPIFYTDTDSIQIDIGENGE